MDLEDVRKKRLEELQERARKQQELQQHVDAVESAAKQYLSREAIARFGTLKAAHPEKAVQAAVVIVQAAQAGKIREQLSDDAFKQLLAQLQEPKKEFKMRMV